MIRAVIFDMDGVLIDSEPANLQLIRDFYHEYHKTVSEKYLQSVVGKSDRDAWQDTLKEWGEEVSYEDYYDLFDKFADSHPFQYQKLVFPEVSKILAWLKNENYQIALASSSKMATIQKVLKQLEIEDYFDVILSGEMFKASKPDPEIYLTAARLLNLEVGECIAIEDSNAGIASCIAAKMKVIARIDERFGADADRADFKVSQLMELTNILKKENQS